MASLRPVSSMSRSGLGAYGSAPPTVRGRPMPLMPGHWWPPGPCLGRRSRVWSFNDADTPASPAERSKAQLGPEVLRAAAGE